MNLPPPFHKASDVRANPEGSINLIDHQGKTLARIPMSTAFELSPEVEGHGYADGHGFRNGGGFGSSFGSGYGYGVGYSGYGYGKADEDGSGRGKSK